MRRPSSPFLIECSCFNEMALVGGSSFRAASLVSKSLLDGFAVGLTATLFVHPQQVIQQIATATNAGILWFCIRVPRIRQKTVKLLHTVQH